jgi:putative CocE/NonD family hydrolase
MSFRVDKDVMVAMRDGVRLATDAWIPADGGPGPVLLVRLPYGKDMTTVYANALLPNVFTMVEAGYAVVYQDCRGTHRSGGEFIPMVNEPADGADTVAWLLEQPWCDGNIGTYGLLLHALVLRGRRRVAARDPDVVDGHGRGRRAARGGRRLR